MEFVKCVCIRLGWRRRRGLGLGFTNPVGTSGVLDVRLCLGRGGVGSVGWEWVVPESVHRCIVSTAKWSLNMFRHTLK